MILLPRLKSFPLPGPVILLAQLPSPVYKGYGSSASDSFANELSTRQIKKSLHVKHEKFKFSRRTKRYAKKKKKTFGTRTQGF